jgi:hypothetical protein
MAVIAVVPALVALAASHSNQVDANDTAGLLDLREVALDHHPSPRWTFQTFARWSIDRIWDHGYFVVQLDTKGDEDPDVLLIVRSDGRDVTGSLVEIRRDGRQVERSSLEVGRPNGRSVSVRVLLREVGIGRGRTAYFWSALSVFTGSACPRTCVDRVPDEGTVEQLLPGVSPSPTPSPTPTPTSSPSPSPGP